MKIKFIAKKARHCITKLALTGTSLLALTVVLTNINATCTFLIHQPKLPEGAKKLRKF